MGAADSPYPQGGLPAGDSSTTSGSTKDIWDLGKYGTAQVTFGQASTPQTGFGGYKHLDRADQEGNTGERPPGVGPSVSAPAAAPPGGASTAVQKTAAELMAYYAGLAYTGPQGKAELEAMQYKLFQAGYYGGSKPTDVAFGSWAGSSKAFHDALLDMLQTQQGGQAPISFTEFVEKAASDRAKSQADNAGSTANPHQLSNPRVIASVLQQTAQNVLGKNLSKDEVDHFVSDYTATEEEYFKSVDSSAAGGNPLTYQPPSIQAAAMDTLSQDHGAEASGNRASDYLGVLQQLLGQSSVPIGTGPDLPGRLA